MKKWILLVSGVAFYLLLGIFLYWLLFQLLFPKELKQSDGQSEKAVYAVRCSAGPFLVAEKSGDIAQ